MHMDVKPPDFMCFVSSFSRLSISLMRDVNTQKLLVELCCPPTDIEYELHHARDEDLAAVHVQVLFMCTGLPTFRSSLCMVFM